MKYRYHSAAPMITAVMLASIAGATASAQTKQSQGTTPAATAPSTTAPSVDFRSSRWLIDRKVVNNNGEVVATVSDLILDRGRGRIEYAVVKTSGSGDTDAKHIAVPYDTLSWEPSAERFMLASTPEQLDTFPEYSADAWKALKNTGKDDQSTLRQRLVTEAGTNADPYSSVASAKRSRISGEVTSVERIRTSKFGEQIEITVKPDSGPVRRIALGPSWYVNGSSAAPMRGSKIVVDTLELPRDPDELLLGTHMRTGDHELQLREANGSAAWTLNTVELGGQRYGTPFSRYLLLSSLPGEVVDCRGAECGKVHDIILDRTSGEIGFLSIDPNQNFMGIGDTKRLIPWSVATVTLKGTVRVDASKEMLLASIETPSELSTLNTGTHAKRVYDAFGVTEPRFEPRVVSSHVADASNAWSAQGAIIKAIDADSDSTMSGEVIALMDVPFEKGIQSARALKVRTADKNAAEQVVLLGPAWYMDNQKPVCKAGDTVKLTACRTTINNEKYWLAKSVDCKDSRVVLLDVGNAPVWQKP